MGCTLGGEWNTVCIRVSALIQLSKPWGVVVAGVVGAASRLDAPACVGIVLSISAVHVLYVYISVCASSGCCWRCCWWL
jgi:hypothetical protein